MASRVVLGRSVERAENVLREAACGPSYPSVPMAWGGRGGFFRQAQDSCRGWWGVRASSLVRCARRGPRGASAASLASVDFDKLAFPPIARIVEAIRGASVEKLASIDPVSPDKLKANALTETAVAFLNFSELQSFTSGSTRRDPEHEAAVFAVLSYFFERCDIFEAPLQPESP